MQQCMKNGKTVMNRNVGRSAHDVFNKISRHLSKSKENPMTLADSHAETSLCESDTLLPKDKYLTNVSSAF